MASHVEGCPHCSAVVERYRQIFASASGVWESAPTHLVARVKELVPETRRVLFGRRLQVGGLAVSRGPLEEFQLVVGDADVSIRLMATPNPEGWSIVGRVPNNNWEVDAPRPITASDGRFQFSVKTLEESAFDLLGPDTLMHVPALSELIENDGV